MRWLLFLLPICCFSQPEVWVELRDGSRFPAVWQDPSIQFRFPDAPPFATRTAGIGLLQRTPEGRFAAHMLNGDHLRVEVASPTFHLDTRFGRLHLDAAELVSLRPRVARPLVEFNHRFFTESGRIDFGSPLELSRTRQMSFSGWYYSEALPGHQGLFSIKRDKLHVMRSHFWHNNRIYIHLNDGDISYVSGESMVKPAQWFHVAIVFNGDLPPGERLALYQNGVATPLRSTGVIPEQTADFGKARFLIPPEQFGWRGRIRLVQVFDRALSAKEVGRLGHVSLK